MCICIKIYVTPKWRKMWFESYSQFFMFKQKLSVANFVLINFKLEGQLYHSVIIDSLPSREKFHL